MKKIIATAPPIEGFVIPPAPWPVDPLAPVYKNPRCPEGCDFYRPDWKTGEFKKDLPTREKPNPHPYRFPIDPNAPKIFGTGPFKYFRDGRQPDVSNPLDNPTSAWSQAFAKYVGESFDNHFFKDANDIPDDLFTQSAAEDPEWEAKADRIWTLIEKQLKDDEMKKTKGQRIAMLEQKVEMLRDELQDQITAANLMQKRLEDFAGMKLYGNLLAQFQIFPANITPKEGQVRHAVYHGNPCLAWISVGRWFIQRPNYSVEEAQEPAKLFWYENIAADKK